METNRPTERVLEHHLNDAERNFQHLKNGGLVSGNFHDQSWRYKGHGLLFIEIGSNQKKRSEGVPLSKIAGKIARCYLVHHMTLRVSSELAVSRLNAFRCLAKTIGNDDTLWPQLPRATLNKTIEDILTCNSISTAYQRGCSLSDFVKFMNNMVCRVDGTDHRFCYSFLKWRHGIKNPIRSSLDATTKEHSVKKEALYEENLHLAISQARSKLSEDPSLEPSFGYDRIRIESLAFAMALGLRIGEICTLSKKAVQEDESTGYFYSLVATEKGAMPAATAIADIWVEPIKEAYAYLLEHCEPARNRAKQIETIGFSFIRDTLNTYRLENPLTRNKIAQLHSAGLNPEEYYFIDELVENFSISAKEIVSGGKHGNCLVPLPKIATAKVVKWLDQRFENWDWSTYSTKYGGYRLRWDDISKYSGASTSSLKKSTWFITDLRVILNDMKAGEVFNPKTVLCTSEREIWAQRWQTIRTQAMGNTGGSSCVVVNISSLTNELKAKYSDYLSAHFKEEFDSEGNKSGKGYEGNHVRPGVERKLSDHLIVVWENQFSARGSLGIIPRPIFRHDYYNYLSQNGGRETIFQRLKILDDKNKPFSISPHDIRRWVTTALLRSGPSETAIDLWMGRSPRQTRHYDYRTAKERAEFVRDRYMRINDVPNDALGRTVMRWRDQGMGEDQIEILIAEKMKALHYTPWGTCSRELYISPCNKGLLCLRGFGTNGACESFQIDSEDLEAKESIIQLRQKYSHMLSALNINYDILSRDIAAELNDVEPLDQHIAFAIDVIRGCDNALQSYNQSAR